MSEKRISLVTSGHPPFDERIFWKFGKSLVDAGFSVSILCSTLKINSTVDAINIIGFDGASYPKRKKSEEFYKLINDFSPDIIICSEMLPVIAALRYKKKKPDTKIILDITEWFPENVAFKFSGIKKWIKYLQLFLPYIYLLQKVNHLIIGEISKKKRYDLIAPSIPKTIIGYYPLLKYFNYKEPNLSKDEITLGYAGVITYERGILTLLQTAQTIADKYPDKNFILLLFGKFTYRDEENNFNQQIIETKNLRIRFAEWTDYDKMSFVIERMDICFDLRIRNFIYNNSLPIKIFEYMACGKPFIYSDIKPIKDEMDVSEYGLLVNPENQKEILNAIERYLHSPELALKHSKNNRNLIENNKNWENESKKLISLIKMLLA